ncbi:MAG: ArsA family ATPase [Acidimicrobiales bacterium]
MDPVTFCQSARVWIVAGKGGVGKTTVSAAFALMAARAGLRTLIVEVEGQSGLGAKFDHLGTLDYRGAVLLPAEGGRAEIRARTLTPDDALVEYFETHGLRRISKRMRSTGTLDVVATAVPGLKDILVLGKIKQIERSAQHPSEGIDVIIVDAPAAGHAVTFLSSSRGLQDAVAIGPIRKQAGDVVEMLSDPARAQVLLVTLPEETPVNEVVETAFLLEEKAGIALGPLVVNQVYPPLRLPTDVPRALARAGVAVTPVQLADVRRARDFRARRQELQQHQLARLAESLPLEQLIVPAVFEPELGLTETEVLATALQAQVERLRTIAAVER